MSSSLQSTPVSGAATVAPKPTTTTTGGISTTDLTMLLVVLIWGANFSVVKATFELIPPLALTAVRFTIGTVLLLGILYLREGTLRVPRGNLLKLIWLGVIGNTAYQVCFITGLAITTAANTSLLVATTPIFVAIIGGLLGIERLTRSTVLGILFAFVGITLVMVGRGASLTAATMNGDLLALCAAICWTIYTLGVRTLGESFSPLAITTWTMVTGTPGLILVGTPQLLGTQWAAVDLPGWGGLAYTTLLALVVAYVLWNLNVRRVGGSRTAVYVCVTPLVASIVAWLMLGESFTVLQVIGAALIIGGVLWTRRVENAKRAKPVREEYRELHSTATP